MASNKQSNSQAPKGINNAVYVVPISSLIGSDSPRLGGESEDHIRMLSASEATLPPILVHRKTLRVIDGMHRLKAAMLRGDQDIKVQFFDGTEASAFVLAVQSNVTHGLPLTMADRTEAAKRIIHSHPQWSDRAVASVTGLSPKTVAAVRARIANDIPRPNVRIGRDGKAHPLNVSEGRLRASRLIAENPGAPLRQIAEAAGISVGTAHDVRERLRLGKAPVSAGRTARKRRVSTGHGTAPPADPFIKDGRRSGRDPVAALMTLKRDPSLRLSETGRALLRLFDAHALCAARWERLAAEVPSHCADLIIDLAVECTRQWTGLVEELRTRRNTASCR